MATKTQVRLNMAGVNALMKSPPVARAVQERARRLAAQAGPGFEVTTDNRHPWVVRSWVEAKTYAARLAEATGKVLTRAVGSP